MYYVGVRVRQTVDNEVDTQNKNKGVKEGIVKEIKTNLKEGDEFATKP